MCPCAPGVMAAVGSPSEQWRGGRSCSELAPRVPAVTKCPLVPMQPPRDRPETEASTLGWRVAFLKRVAHRTHTGAPRPHKAPLLHRGPSGARAGVFRASTGLLGGRSLLHIRLCRFSRDIFSDVSFLPDCFSYKF